MPHIRKAIQLMLLCSAPLTSCPTAFALPPHATAITLDAETEARCLEILRNALVGDEFWPAMHAAETLSQNGYGAEVRKRLTPRLPLETNLRQRCGLARELIRAGDDGQATVLLEVLANPDAYGHVHACESMYKVDVTGDGQLLKTAMSDQSNPVKALMAAAALAKHGDQNALKFIRANVSHPETGWVSAWILGSIGSKEDVASLKQTLEKTKDARQRAYYEHALALQGDSDGRAALLKNLAHEDPVVQADAAYMAGDAGIESAEDELIQLLNDAHLDVRIRAAQGLLTLARGPEAPQEVEDSKKVVAPEVVLDLPPGPNNSRNSEGDFIQTRDGRLLFIYTYFGKGTGDDYDVAELRERVSLDQGKTWLPDERTIVKPESGLNVMSVSLLRLQSGEIALIYLSKISPSDCRPDMRISTDEGKTWGEPVKCITDEVDYYVLNNGRAVQTREGRLVLPVCLHRTLADKKNDWAGELMCYFSDDKGKTWKRSKSVFKGFVNGNRATVQEPGVIELADGRLMMFIRASVGSQMLSYSEDGGNTWSDPVPSNIISPLSPASIKRIPKTGDLLLVWNNHAGIAPELKDFRTPLTVAISKDDGKTWEAVKNVHEDPFGWYCYTAIDFVGDDVLLGHCAGDRRGNGLTDTKVTRFNLNWLYDDKK
ncbi:exo-alpha-sialidase [Planctomicrobium sp. SH661]|uniref:exo-alpha-sialidase n=1 Tax=Planctomicrobium sp. SH661 TaxID=3448124 RepID=UPI003F5BD453